MMGLVIVWLVVAALCHVALLVTRTDLAPEVPVWGPVAHVALVLASLLWPVALVHSLVLRLAKRL